MSKQISGVLNWMEPASDETRDFDAALSPAQFSLRLLCPTIVHQGREGDNDGDS